MPSVSLTLTVRTDIGGFVNKANAVAIDGSVATYTGYDVDNIYYETNAVSVVPAGATIVGVVATVRARCTSLPDNAVMFYAGASWGRNINDTPYTSTSLTDYTVGSQTSVPSGLTNVADWSFFRFRAWGSGFRTDTHSVDGVTITVYYEFLAGGNTLFFGENF